MSSYLPVELTCSRVVIDVILKPDAFVPGLPQSAICGSIRAALVLFRPENLGVTEDRLYKYHITEDHPFENEKCKILKRRVFKMKKKDVSLQL